MTAAQTSRVLIVDDNVSIHEDFRRILVTPSPAVSPALDQLEALLFGGEAAPPSSRSRAFEVVSATQGEDGVTLARAAVAEGRPFSVAFVDMRMPPGWDGVRTTEELWRVDPDLQVVICTAYSDYSWDEVVERLGQSDRLLLLKKPFDRAEVWQLAGGLSQKRDLMSSVRLKLDDSERMAQALQRANADLEREVVERKTVEERLRHHAYHDPLTGLPNRAHFMSQLDRCVARARRHPEYSYAVLFIDLDNFKFVNDSLGHETGDRLLVEVAQRLRNTLRAEDVVSRTQGDTSARLGGDEFVVVLDGIVQPTDAAIVAERVLSCISAPLMLGSQELCVNASIGIALSSHGYSSADDVLRDADTAMYRAKSAGKCRFALFDPGMHAAARRRLRIENDLRRAVNERRFGLVYQPIVSAATGEVVAVEALLRLPGADGYGPADFIPVAEETGLIVPMGEWVVEEACRTAARLRRDWPRHSDVRVNVNVSRRQLLDSRLPAILRRALAEHGLAPETLGVEITETAVIRDFDAALDRLLELKAIGVGLHLDDFGTGYSSLSCLHRFPLDVVKIDREFVATSEHNASYVPVVKAIVALADSLGLGVTIEGIETPQQMAQIRALGCDFAQGYLISRPVELDRLLELLRGGAAFGASLRTVDPLRAA